MQDGGQWWLMSRMKLWWAPNCRDNNSFFLSSQQSEINSPTPRKGCSPILSWKGKQRKTKIQPPTLDDKSWCPVGWVLGGREKCHGWMMSLEKGMDSLGAPSCPEWWSRMCRSMIAPRPHPLGGKQATLCQPLRPFLVKGAVTHCFVIDINVVASVKC